MMPLMISTHCDHPNTDFWDSTPMAINLDQAWQGYPNEKRFRLGTLEARDQLLQLAASSSPPHKLPIQATAYKSLMQIGFPNDIQAHVSKHIFQFAGTDGDANASLDLTASFMFLRKLRKHEAMQVIKTWCNSWATSYRYHESTLFPCLLGCPFKKDELDHYLFCPHVWFVARTAFPQLAFERLSDRLCVDNPCTVSLRVLAATFPAYHSVKPSLGSAPMPFDAARCHFEGTFYSAVRASGLSPDSPAD